MKKTLITLMLLGTCAVYAKKCPSGTCEVPSNADCAFYQEQVLTDPTQGTPIEHTGELIFVFRVSNCIRETSTKSGNLKHVVAKSLSGSLSFTAGGSVSSSVKAQVGVPLVGNVDATLGVTTSISATAGGTYGTTTTDEALWAYSVPPCQDQSANLLADWVSGSWTKKGYIKGYYYTTDNPNGPLQTVTCENVDGSSNAEAKYKQWHIDFNPDQPCPGC